ncbi:hypothetical protein [Ferrovum sp.]|jgi:hypothetical protein|uniref:hypothetical protein n=1 Tax=Ferrovum sp. TaxID=2609467 RepID=UPI00260F5E3C|nr:hypothetical protein [Ferrovum sp.]
MEELEHLLNGLLIVASMEEASSLSGFGRTWEIAAKSGGAYSTGRISARSWQDFGA